MSKLILTPHHKWHDWECDCVWQNDVQIHGECDPACGIPVGYLKGCKKPNYPVPAIIHEVDVVPVYSDNTIIGIDVCLWVKINDYHMPALVQVWSNVS